MLETIFIFFIFCVSIIVSWLYGRHSQSQSDNLERNKRDLQGIADRERSQKERIDDVTKRLGDITSRESKDSARLGRLQELFDQVEQENKIGTD